MNTRFRSIWNAPFLLIGALVQCALWSCELDQGLGPSQTRISGKVIFVYSDSTKSRPENIDEVRVVATANLPPTGFGDVYFSNPVRFDVDTTTYEIAAPVGVYPAIGVLWKPRGRDWSFTNLLGIYGLRLPFEFDVKPVELTKQNPLANSVDLFALWSFSQFDARVEGELTVIGAWPPDTEIVLLGAFINVPDLSNVGNLLGSLGGLPLPVSPSSDAKRPYETAVRNGEYKFIALFWKGKNIDWDEIRLLGYYRDLQDPSKPGHIIVPAQGGISDINFTADFTTLPAGLELPEAQ
jgi:hypothetical protein